MRRAPTLLALLLALPAPALAREWYEAYQEALKALARGQHQAAVFHLEQAIRQRGQPGANLRTYGTNVEPAYHPYLKLAEAHLGLGSVEGAMAALRRSESFGIEPTEERARLRARADLLAERLRPQPPPPITTTTSTTTPPPSTLPSPSPTPFSVPSAAEPTPMSAPTAAPVERRPQPPERSPPSPAPTAEPMATLEVLSQPPGALVYVDDELLGATNRDTGRLVKRSLAAGRHQVRVALDGYEDFVHDLELSAGANTTLRSPLVARSTPPWRPRPGTGSALAALSALGGLALWFYARRRRAPPGEGAAQPLSPAGPWTPPPAGPSPTPRPETPTPEEALPARFGEYVLLERLGRGGMATVFKAERQGELRALKRPRSSASDDPQFLERFLREAEIGRTLHHPNIVRIYERGEVNGVPYFTMELIDGEALSTRLNRDGPLAPAEAARTMLQIAEALDYAHNKGVIHRDLKPSNTMVDRGGRLRVMDFGIARAQRFGGLTLTGSFLGSPDYAAPEAILGSSVDARSDLYSVGVMLFELLTGRRPFEGDTPFAVLQKHCTEKPTPPSRLRPDLPKKLEAIALRLLAKAPDERFASAEELLLALRSWLDAPA